MEAERDKREVRKFLYIERYSGAILPILMSGEVSKIKLGKTSFPNWRHILSQNKEYLLQNKSPWYGGNCHGSAFIY